MKRIPALLMSAVMLLLLAACSSREPSEQKPPRTEANTQTDSLRIRVGDYIGKKGVLLSAHEDGSDAADSLSAAMTPSITNITYDWLPAGLDREAYGSHNGRNYLAYTFKVCNTGEIAVDYRSTMKIAAAAGDADEAVRVMLYRNGEPAVYAKRNSTDADMNRPPAAGAEPLPFETIYRKKQPAGDAAQQELPDPMNQEQNRTPVETTDELLPIIEFPDDEVVFDLEYSGLEPGAADQYTVVIWIEGLDPECDDSIVGDSLSFDWVFD